MKSVCRSGTKSSLVCVARLPRPVVSPASDGDLGLILLVARVAGIRAGVQEGGESLLLVALQDRRSHSGSHHEDQCDESGEDRADHREVRPGDAPHVHHGEGYCPEHQRGAQVRLQEDERSRCQAEAEVAQRALPRRPAPGAIDHEPGKRENKQELAELRWLEAEERQVRTSVVNRAPRTRKRRRERCLRIGRCRCRPGAPGNANNRRGPGGTCRRCQVQRRSFACSE